jgi:hypothetical protein
VRHEPGVAKAVERFALERGVTPVLHPTRRGLAEVRLDSGGDVSLGP